MIRFFLLQSMVALICLSGTAQEDTASIKQGSITVRKKPKEIDYWPHIAGKFSGKIEPAFLCSENGIRNNVKWQVISFTFIAESTGGSVEKKVNGNALTNELCELVSKLRDGSMIYIQDIYALDHKNKKVRLNSLRYEIVGSTADKYEGEIEERYPEPR